MEAMNGMMDLYPSRGRSLSLPITRGHSHGYRFNVSSTLNYQNTVDSPFVTLSRIEYVMEATNCNQTEDLMNDVTFRLLMKSNDDGMDHGEWNEINVEYVIVGTREKLAI